MRMRFGTIGLAVAFVGTSATGDARCRKCDDGRRESRRTGRHGSAVGSTMPVAAPPRPRRRRSSGRSMRVRPTASCARTGHAHRTAPTLSGISSVPTPRRCSATRARPTRCTTTTSVPAFRSADRPGGSRLLLRRTPRLAQPDAGRVERCQPGRRPHHRQHDSRRERPREGTDPGAASIATSRARSRPATG